MAEGLLEVTKLTKKLFLKLPQGRYLVSGVGESLLKRDFQEYVAPPEEREAQWQRIKACRADNLQCEVYTSEADFIAWIQSHSARRA